MLKLENVSSFYGESLAINKINLEINEGSFHGILGKNGMGKTTLLKTIMGLMDKTNGLIHLADKDISKLQTHNRAIEGLGYVPQGRGIMPQYTIEENMIIGTFARDKDNTNNINEDFEFTLKLFPILKKFWKKKRRGFIWRSTTTVSNSKSFTYKTQNINIRRTNRRYTAKSRWRNWKCFNKIKQRI